MKYGSSSRTYLVKYESTLQKEGVKNAQRIFFATVQNGIGENSSEAKLSRALKSSFQTATIKTLLI